jgi:hypothetical protein
MTGSAGRGSAVVEQATEFWDDPGRSRQVVKEQFPEVTLGLGRREERIRASICTPRLWKVRIMGRHHQFLDAPNLVIDESTQLRGAGSLSSSESRVQKRDGDSGDDREDRTGKDTSASGPMPRRCVTGVTPCVLDPRNPRADLLVMSVFPPLKMDARLRSTPARVGTRRPWMPRGNVGFTLKTHIAGRIHKIEARVLPAVPWLWI